MTGTTLQLDGRPKRDVERAEAHVFAGAAYLLGEECSILVVEMSSLVGHWELGRKCSGIGHRSSDVDDSCVLAIPQ